MSAHSDLETRLRTGLRAAGEALPPAGRARPGDRATGARTSGKRTAARRRGTSVRMAAAAAVVVTAAAASAVALTAGDGGGERPDVEVAPATDPSTSTTSADLGPAVDPPAGSAVATGAGLVAYGPDGQQGETLSLAPLTMVQSVVSDRHGGWIACGSAPAASPAPSAQGAATTTTVARVEVPSWSLPEARDEYDEYVVEAEGRIRERLEAFEDEIEAAGPVQPNTYRFRPGQEPEPLGFNVYCVADALGVTEVDGHDMLLYASPVDFSLHQYDLVTGADGAVPIDTGMLSPGLVSVGGGRLAVLNDTDGLRVWDLATGEVAPVGPVDLPMRAADATSGDLTSELTLSPDGTQVAVLIGDISVPTDLAVIDLASGAEVFRTSVPIALEGAELSYDGATVAVGSYYDSYGPVRLYDVATGAARTIDAHGVLP